MNDFDKLNCELRDAGVPNYEFVGEEGTPVDTLVNTNISSKPYIGILLKYLPGLAGNQQEMVIRALTEKSNKQATPYLLDIFKKSNEFNKSLLWTVANALYTIDDKAAYPEIIELCKNTQLGSSRQMLLGTLVRVKTDEAYHILADCLKDPEVKGHAIEALGKLGDIRALELLEKTEVEKGKYEYKAKQTAISRLIKKSGS